MFLQIKPAEVCSMDAEAKDGGSYRVEVSGWDTGENFFVERTLLNWENDGRKEVILRTPLQEGALVFVRLVSEPMGTRTIPMTYQVHKIAKAGADQGAEVELERMHPKLAESREHGTFQKCEAVKS